MAPSSVSIHHTQRSATLNHRLCVSESAAVTVLPAYAKRSKKVEFYETGVIALFKKENYKVHMFLRITSNCSRLTVDAFNTGPGENLVDTFCLPGK